MRIGRHGLPTLAAFFIIAGGLTAYTCSVPLSWGQDDRAEPELTKSISEQSRQTCNLYYLDENHTLEYLPVNLSVNQTGNVIIGIVNHEGRNVNYTVIASTNDSAQLRYVNDLTQTFLLDNDTTIGYNITIRSH